MTITWTSTIVTVIALAVSVAGGAWLTPAVLRAAARASADEAPQRTTYAESEAAEEGPTGAVAVQALRGGMWVGLLERFAITGSVLAGFPAGIAVVVAIKGLGRYPELRDNPGASERFVVGTLASVVWSGLVGFGALALIVVL
ncbi:hypothetical protein CLV28_1698 [Sediminihabitans luteus]|uniref:Uncharacterized protein n=1 Tax=Sediminihabitans luteus TaxID=1138585 RepID=A0A2M9CQM3_9CELL|nr:hypothetical protein [Sediminihabitans luteus]PJJ74204.1 hypothetical protein CLV28_1698 [Sediminihabitans luteus]GII99057.1 hypothetical protein Slu03_14350 [Sediminihabitans luteus]